MIWPGIVLVIATVVPLAAFALTPAQAYHKAAQFLRAQAATGWETAELGSKLAHYSQPIPKQRSAVRTAVKPIFAWWTFRGTKTIRTSSGT
jgi:hypothetical protein